MFLSGSMTDCYLPFESKSRAMDSIIANDQLLPSEQQVGLLEPVAYFHNAMLTGVTVSQEGQIFVNFPKWGDNMTFTVAEILAGQGNSIVAYPDDKINLTDLNDQQHLLCPCNIREQLLLKLVDKDDSAGIVSEVMKDYYDSISDSVREKISAKLGRKRYHLTKNYANCKPSPSITYVFSRVSLVICEDFLSEFSKAAPV